ncbi:peptidoglycan recognition protein family protein [Streptomyces parvus]|uniref:peptidoglycan recognition protein family protein n=1 Tax=Streptomyces parvus TaxID=66428 RepID=UPI00210175BF|nr:N-acetylmuramoyl-L-alanine amidase [Streptomyces parvus]MCQ1577563.1 N-acetylmuramoyl-L-alanine amidase [Streptomyces parvus]
MSPRGTRARRASTSKRTIWLAAGAVVLAGTGVTAVNATGGSGDTGTDDSSRPAKAHTLALAGKDAKKRELPRTETQLFSLVGVSWENSADDFEGTAQIRTRSADDGAWTDWRDLDFGIRAPETKEGDASGVRGASEPLWVGPSDAVQARVVAGGKETAVPDALRLDMIDPGETKGGKGNGKGKPSDKPEKTDTAAPSPTVPGEDPAPSTAPEPTGIATESAVAPATEQPPTPPVPSETATQDPPEPTAEPSAPAPSQEPTAEPSTAPTTEPTTPAPSETATQDPPQPTAEPSAPAPSQEPTAEPSTAPTTEPTTPAPSETATQDPPQPTAPAEPTIVSRADWGADESLVADPPSYLDKVDAVFVHHTAGTNNYDCAESPAIIRAILTYHVKTNGWNDLGYNFFVDKCGTVFEGRAGGVDKPVRGAHTYGFNGYSSGVSLLGDYENGGTPTAAAKQAIADISAWKLGLHGVAPEARVTLTAAGDTGVWNTGDKATLNTISGHRDGYATLCPGATLYSALPEIRSTAGASIYTS